MIKYSEYRVNSKTPYSIDKYFSFSEDNPPDQTDLPGAVQDRGPSSGSERTVDTSAASSASRVREKALAFTVPGDEDGDRDPSLIRKHPPLRFRKLEDQQVEISQERINIKQAEAEKRRSAVSGICAQIMNISNADLNLSDNSRKSQICQIFQRQNAEPAYSEGTLPEPSGVGHRESSRSLRRIKCNVKNPK